MQNLLTQNSESQMTFHQLEAIPEFSDSHTTEHSRSCSGSKAVYLHHHGTELQPGLTTGVKDFVEVQNCANAAGQFVDWSAQVQGYL